MNSRGARTFLLFSISSILLCSCWGEKNASKVVDVKVNHTEANEKPDGRFKISPRFYFPPYIYDTDETNKIAGGSYAVEEQFPFMAVVHRLLEKGGISQCGGSIISKRWVLTAGHCITQFPRRVLVVFGIIDKKGIKYDYTTGTGISMVTSQVVVHPQYYQTTNDIALLYMPQDIPYTRKIQPIRLAGYNEIRESFADMSAYVIGWGKDMQTASGVKLLKYAVLPIIYNSECSRYWNVNEKNICTATDFTQNACQGDSGGPLVVYRNNKPLQVGIVSYGDGNCPSERPGVFTRVSTFAQWIETVSGIRF